MNCSRAGDGPAVRTRVRRHRPSVRNTGSSSRCRSTGAKTPSREWAPREAFRSNRSFGRAPLFERTLRNRNVARERIREKRKYWSCEYNDPLCSREKNQDYQYTLKEIACIVFCPEHLKPILTICSLRDDHFCEVLFRWDG